MRKRMSRAAKSHKQPLRFNEFGILDAYDGIDAEDFRPSDRGKSARPRYNTEEEVFKCRHCRRFVCPLPSGGHHRNHCPFCLYSRHVDDRQSGDRLSTCGSSMEPVGRFQRTRGEDVIVHRCLGCGFERFNRVAADDDYELMLELPMVPPRTSRDLKAREVEVWLEEQHELERAEWDVSDAG
ncbi:RNHCP domain-containing protein [Ktedonobacter robiniae]|uniref:RNHCP domain-containing protein n=1 Tax=Ktedonobacter robiniae TaxID=2778365 RepID=A0ABQ3UMI9_9CHLR|nr:RNHCP domain-containing protein [Ktedonobacter robiniae]GHO53961.1 hypothetical protein KSB_24360 [Ktedonobacter robiniae]